MPHAGILKLHRVLFQWLVSSEPKLLIKISNFMKDSHSQFTGSIPEIYDTHLGPLLFEFSARDLVARAKNRIPPNGRILEVVCGTGILTHHLQKAFPETVEIIDSYGFE